VAELMGQGGLGWPGRAHSDGSGFDRSSGAQAGVGWPAGDRI